MKLKYLVLLAVTGTIISLDQLTKHLVTERFHLGQSMPIIDGFFNLTYVRNPGAAFGLFSQGHPSWRVPFFIIIPLVALAVIFTIFRKLEDRDLKMSSALSLVIGGACGNLIDRASYNYVIDFLDFHWRYSIHFPAFNVADMAITIGVGILILDIFQKERLESKKATKTPKGRHAPDPV